MVIGRSARITRPLMKLLAIFCNPKPTPTPTAPAKTANAAEMNPGVLKDNENANDQHDVADDLGNRVLERTIESTFARTRLKRKRFVLEEIQKTAIRSATSRKI